MSFEHDNKFDNYRFTRISLVICFAAIFFWGFIYYPKWQNGGYESTLSYDVSGYYLYLPAAIIYKDLKQVAFLPDVMEKYQPATAVSQVYLDKRSGNHVMKYTMGQSLVFAPWFFVAHAIASIHPSYPPDGFSKPFQMLIGIGMMIYAFIGIYFLSKVLRHYFSDITVSISMICIILGSNYLEYGGISNAMTHNSLFTNYCLLIWLSISFYKTPKYSLACLIGFFIGLNILIRPTEIISSLIPLLWGLNLTDSLSLKKRYDFFRSHRAKYFLAISTTIILGTLQLAYWKYVTGSWIVYSYQEQGFNWLQPHLIEGILSYKTGWLVYSPIMILSLLGFIKLYKNKELFYTTLLFSSLFIYLCFAWDIWWYGGSIGQRAMVQSYPILAIPLAAFFERPDRQSIIFWMAISFSLCSIVFNNWLTHQGHKGNVLKPGFMNKPYLLESLLESETYDLNLKLLDGNKVFKGDRKNIEIIYDQSLDSLANERIVLKDSILFTPSINLVAEDLHSNWLRVKAHVSIEEKDMDTWKMAQLRCKLFNGEELLSDRFFRIHRLLDPYSKKTIYYDFSLENMDPTRAQIYFWNPNQDKAVAIKNILVEAFD